MKNTTPEQKEVVHNLHVHARMISAHGKCAYGRYRKFLREQSGWTVAHTHQRSASAGIRSFLEITMVTHEIAPQPKRLKLDAVDP